MDFRYWSGGVWTGLNIAVVAALCGMRFLPQLYEDWRERRADVANVLAKYEKAERAKAERERVAALRKGRSRRMY